jgi:hypothetical protein
MVNMEGYNSVMGEILRKYPVTNDSQWKYECMDGISSYMIGYNGVMYDSVFVQSYAGIRGIFVRHSMYDDNEGIYAYKYAYNNVDPWLRKFKAYKNGNKTRYTGYNNQYMCEPIFCSDFTSYPKAYVLTTSIDGIMIYCLDVIEHIK